MLELTNIDLTTDADARYFVKNERVDVLFATSAGELISREGPNRYLAGDALITGSTGDKWSVSRDRFDAKYESNTPHQEGHDGPYRAKQIAVLGKQLTEPFLAARSAGGDMLNGAAHDWLLQYAPGDYGIIENARFQQVYQLQVELRIESPTEKI